MDMRRSSSTVESAETSKKSDISNIQTFKLVIVIIVFTCTFAPFSIRSSAISFWPLITAQASGVRLRCSCGVDVPWHQHHGSTDRLTKLHVVDVDPAVVLEKEVPSR